MTESTFLDQIRLTEKEAARLISKAHESAQASQETARVQIAGRLEAARSEAARIRQDILDDAEAEAEVIAREAAAAAAMNAGEITDSVADRLEQAVQVVVERIVNLSVDR